MISVHIQELSVDDHIPQIKPFMDQFNSNQELALPPYDRVHFWLAAYEGEQYIGGVVGSMVWGLLYIQLLAVDHVYRGKGIGADLLQAIEDQARQQGAKVSELTTMSWQAPHFYMKYGYTIFGEIHDIPIEGQTKYYMKKNLLSSTQS